MSFFSCPLELIYYTKYTHTRAEAWILLISMLSRFFYSV